MTGVWEPAPCVVALAFVAAGTYVCWTIDRPRTHSPIDWLIVSIAGVMLMASFLAEGGAVLESRVPAHFPAVLYWAGFLLGAGWFVWTELRLRLVETEGRVD